MTNFYIASAQPSETGDITCVAQNEIGESRRTFTVVVNCELGLDICLFCSPMLTIFVWKTI